MSAAAAGAVNADGEHVAQQQNFDPRRLAWVRRAVLFFMAASIVVGSALVAQHWFALAALAEMRQSSSFAIAGNTAALQTKLQKFRLVPIALSTDPELRQAVEAPTEALRDSLNRRFEEIAEASGAAAVYLIDGSGVTFAASNYRSNRTFIGQDYSFRSYFRNALDNRNAQEFALGTVSGAPGLYLSRSVAAKSGTAKGVIVVKLQFDDIESYWRKQNRLILAADAGGRVIVTNHEPLRFQKLGPLSSGVLEAPPPALSTYLGNAPVLATVYPIADGGWTLASFEPLRPALATAKVSGLMTGASLSGLALSAFALLLYRLARNARRAKEVIAYRAHLEAEVGERTRQLQASYRQLEEETARRESTQAELRVMQDEITQLNRLAILGQLSAKFAHEINQPLTAMRNYVENSLKLLALGDSKLVASNLETMSGLMARAGRITEELRAFSRRQPSTAAEVRAGRAVDGALLISNHALKAACIRLERRKEADKEIIRVDQIRIEQVILNVVQNAIEALRGLPDPKLCISSHVEAQTVVLIIADNGPGVENVQDLFIPFRSGKEHGLGLGLSISKEILSEYGGELCYRPGDKGGAVFVIRLPRVK